MNAGPGKPLSFGCQTGNHGACREVERCGCPCHTQLRLELELRAAQLRAELELELAGGAA